MKRRMIKKCPFCREKTVPDYPVLGLQGNHCSRLSRTRVTRELR